MRALMAEKTGMDPDGMVKWEVSLRSMIAAWLRKKVESCAKEMESAIVVAHMGRIRMKDLSSSTCVMVHWFHLLVCCVGDLIMAALSKKLYCGVCGSFLAPKMSECCVGTS